MSISTDILYAAVAALTSPVWGYRLWRTGKWRTDWSGRFGHCRLPGPDARPTLLIHAVSVGEVNAVTRLVERLNQKTDKGWRIVISATTDTGFARAKQVFEPPHHVVRYPLDLTRCVRRFLDSVRPDLVALTELEVWPNFVSDCDRRRVPVCVINGRLSERSFQRYRHIKSWLRPTFSKLSAALVQSRSYADRFTGLGVLPDRVTVVDSMKWDTTPPGIPPGFPPGISPGISDAIHEVAGPDELARALGIDRSVPVVVAGSTGPGEEKMLVDACPPDAQLVLVPRKPERFDEVARSIPGVIRRSDHPDDAPPPGTRSRVILIDTMGELNKAYALADVAVVGRSFMGDLYGSNPLEPIALGKPTVIGPYFGDFSDIVDTLRDAGGIEVTDDPGRVIAGLLMDRERAKKLGENGLKLMLARRGATDRHVDRLIRLMSG